jgi:hypothetical protein
VSYNSTSSSSDEDILENMHQDDLLIFQMMATRASTLMIFSIHIRWKNGGGQSMDLTIGVQDVLGTIVSHTSIIQDFDKLYIRRILRVGFSNGPYH